MKTEDLIYEIVKKNSEKLDDLDKRLDDMHEVQVKQEANIDHHIKRSDQFEELLILHKDNNERHKTPLTVKGLFMKIVWLCGGVGAIVGATIGVLKLLDMLKQ